MKKTKKGRAVMVARASELRKENPSRSWANIAKQLGKEGFKNALGGKWSGRRVNEYTVQDCPKLRVRE